MHHLRTRRWVGGLLAATAMIFGGCTITPDAGVVFFPQPYHVTDAADAIRKTAVHPLAIPRETAKQALDGLRIEPGDVLQITPVKAETLAEFQISQTVQPDGTIDLASYGHIKAAGLTVDEVEAAANNAIKAKLGKDERVEIFQVKWASKVFYIDGEIRSPGSYTLDGRETVLDAIFAAGGLSRRASHNNIIISRPTEPCSPRIVLPVCYDDILQLGDSTTNYQIRPGDRIFVPTVTILERIYKVQACLPCNRPQAAAKLPTAPCASSSAASPKRCKSCISADTESATHP